MKLARMLVVGMMLLAGLCMSVQAEDSGENAVPSKGIRLVPVGKQDDAMLERVRSFVEDNTAIPVRMSEAQALVGGGLDDEGRATLEKMEREDLFIIALVEPEDEKVTNHGVILPDDKVAIVNTRALRPAEEDSEKYGRRLEKQTMKSVGMLLGLDACPNPHCALWAYQDLEQLDAMGRNFCPPCLSKAQKAAQQEGVILIDNKFRLVPPLEQP